MTSNEIGAVKRALKLAIFVRDRLSTPPNARRCGFTHPPEGSALYQWSNEVALGLTGVLNRHGVHL